MTEQDWRVKTAILKHRLSKFNPNHDEVGRFSSGPGGGGGGVAHRVGAGYRKPRRKPAAGYKVTVADKEGYPEGHDLHDPSKVTGRDWLVSREGGTEEGLAYRSSKQEAIDHTHVLPDPTQRKKSERKRRKRQLQSDERRRMARYD